MGKRKRIFKKNDELVKDYDEVRANFDVDKLVSPLLGLPADTLSIDPLPPRSLVDADEEELERLEELYSEGVLTKNEFETLKQKLSAGD